MGAENKKKQFMVVNERLRNLSKAIENLEDFVGTLRDGTPPPKSEDSGPMEKETFGSVWCSLPSVLLDLTDRIQNHYESLKDLLGQ